MINHNSVMISVFQIPNHIRNDRTYY